MIIRNWRSVISLARKTPTVYRTIGCDGVPRWCPNMKWGRRGHWWLGLRHGSEPKVDKRVGKDEGGCFHRTQASRQLQEFTQQERRYRREGEVDLESRCDVELCIWIANLQGNPPMTQNVSTGRGFLFHYCTACA
jgi:hypothetical protein